MKRIRLGYLTGAMVMLALAVQGNVLTWKGTSSGLWNITGNWVEGAAPQSTLNATAEVTELVFAQSGANNLAVQHNNVTTWINKLTFNDNVGASSMVVNLTRASDSAARTVNFTGTGKAISVASGVSGNITIGGAGQGAIQVDGAWTVHHEGSGTLSLGQITQRTGTTGQLTKTGSGSLVLTGVNSFLQGAVVNGGSLTLTENAQMLFTIGANGVNAALTGSAAVNLNGNFLFNLTGAGTTVGDSWTVVNVATLTETYGSTFSVVGFDDAGGNKWTKAINGTDSYEFSESTGVLTVIPEPATIGMLGLGALITMVIRRQHR